MLSAHFEDKVSKIVASGVDMIQLRDKNVSDRELIRRFECLRRLVDSANTMLIVNDRVDVAHAANADGVHLGQDDLKVATARRILRTDQLIGVSTH